MTLGVISHIYQEIDQLPEKQSDHLYRLACIAPPEILPDGSFNWQSRNPGCSPCWPACAGDSPWITCSCHCSSKVCEPLGKIFGGAMQVGATRNSCFSLIACRYVMSLEFLHSR